METYTHVPVKKALKSKIKTNSAKNLHFLPIFDESVLSLYYRALANRYPDWCLLETLFS
jgi:hypothetical protein